MLGTRKIRNVQTVASCQRWGSVSCGDHTKIALFVTTSSLLALVSHVACSEDIAQAQQALQHGAVMGVLAQPRPRILAGL